MYSDFNGKCRKAALQKYVHFKFISNEKEVTVARKKTPRDIMRKKPREEPDLKAKASSSE